MTGQGSKQFEQIKKSNAKTGTLDLTRRYKTAGGHTVRNLRIETTNKAVIGGNVIVSAHYHDIIVGQCLIDNAWHNGVWNERGQHTQEKYTLVEQKEEATQGNLF